MTDKISIIVPVYNVEKYIDECVNSLVTQTYTNLEIILVNDGSTDTSGQKCDEWAKKDNRIKVFHQANTGGARGGVITGVNACTGNYIAFLDSDDWFVPHAMESLLSHILKYDADCVQFEYLHIKNGTGQKTTHSSFEIILGDEIRRQILGSGNDSEQKTPTQWSFGRTDKLYKAGIVKQIIPELDPKVTIYEDVNMSCHIANVCNKIVILEDCYYYCWRHIDGSISKRMLDKTIDEHIFYLDAMEQFAQKNNLVHMNIDHMRDNVFSDLMVMALFNNIPLSKKIKYLRRLKSLVIDKKYFSRYVDRHAFITRNALKYIAHFDCFIPSILSLIYIKIKKTNY